MNGYLRQSTASQARLLGPFIDDTDFKTASTGLSIANTDIKLRANGTTLSNKNSGGGTHQVNGMYSVTWDATDTANVGELFFSVKVAGALQVFGSYVVLEEAIYDALFAASAAAFDSSQRVTPIAVDGVSYATMMEDMMAVIYGVAVPSGSTVAFKKISDGTTTTRSVTYGATDGERTASS